MESMFHYVAPPSRCGYLPTEQWSLEYEVFSAITAAEYQERLRQGWRRFGSMLFRPRCRACRACQSLRVVVDRFRADRSQRRARKANESRLKLVIGAPAVTRAKLTLYDRYHAFQASAKHWPHHPARDVASYEHAFVLNPFVTEEWCYFLDDALIGVGYVDVLSAGLSAIYFFYEPDQRRYSLGTWNVLRLIEDAAARGLPHLYLGYYVTGCASLSYKANFVPNQVLWPDGHWHDFRR
jgi:arginyl-tRNA--protein-N-Asp/Glu arginylyltransferase